MKEQKCPSCQTVNVLEFTLRPNNTDAITIRCRGCKKLVLVDAVHTVREQAR